MYKVTIIPSDLNSNQMDLTIETMTEFSLLYTFAY